MTYSIKIECDTHYGVGPYSVDGHAVSLHVPPDQDGFQFAVCLDCGYLTDDIRQYAARGCDPDANDIPETWRERIDAEGLPA